MYNVFSRFIIRTPLLPYNQLTSLLKNTDILKENISDNQIQEAIYIASPLLYRELKKYLQDEIKNEKEKDRIISSVIRYLSRMSTRCTPFGLFAGCSVGEIGLTTNIVPQKSIKRKTRLDMYYLCALYKYLVQQKQIRENIKYYPNTSLYTIGDKYRYIESKLEEIKIKYLISEVERSSYLKKIIKHTEGGAYIQDLTSLLITENVTKEEAFSYIEELINAQIIVGELNQVVTGDDYYNRIIELLKKINFNDNTLSHFFRIQTLLEELDSPQESNKISKYTDIEASIRKINVPYDEKFLFQVDMIKDMGNPTIGNDIIEELQSTMKFLNRITESHENHHLSKFKLEFHNRYENREVPLLEALDTEIGLGYPITGIRGDISPLIDSFLLPKKSNERTINLNAFQSILLKKTLDCLSHKEKEVVFVDNDVKEIHSNWNDLPPTLYSLFNIIKSNGEGCLISLKSIGGVSGANLLARFSHTDEKIEQLVRNIVQKEQELTPDVVFAEIAHLPESRIGNILFRPHIRKYELLYLASSDLPREDLIYVSDLMLSVQKGRIVIRSKSLHKEVIPRLTNAHNYSNNSMPVYRFLCDIQKEKGRPGLYFDWGYLEQEFEFLPRVRYKNTILSPATWNINTADLKSILSTKDDEELLYKIERWRESISLPKLTLMSDGDNQLYINWKSIVSIRSSLSVINNRQTIKLKELLFEEKDIVVKNEKNIYFNECIVTFYKNEK